VKLVCTSNISVTFTCIYVLRDDRVLRAIKYTSTCDIVAFTIES